MNQLEIAPKALRMFSAFAQQIEVDTHGARVVSLLIYCDGSGHVEDMADSKVYLVFDGLEDLCQQLRNFVTNVSE